MKYKAHQESTGKWFVNTHKTSGKQYGKRFDNELEARQYALIESHHYYQAQMDAAWRELEKISETTPYGEVTIVGSNIPLNQGDLMC